MPERYVRFPGNWVGGPHRPPIFFQNPALHALIKQRAKPAPDSNRIIVALRRLTIPIGNNRFCSKRQREGGRTSLHSSALMCPSLWTPKFPQLTRKSLKILRGWWSPPPGFPATPHSTPALLPCYGRGNITVSHPRFLFYTLLRFASILFGKSGD